MLQTLQAFTTGSQLVDPAGGADSPAGEVDSPAGGVDSPDRERQCQVEAGHFVVHTVPLPPAAESPATKLRWRQELVPGDRPELRAAWAIDDVYIERLTVSGRPAGGGLAPRGLSAGRVA